MNLYRMNIAYFSLILLLPLTLFAATPGSHDTFDGDNPYYENGNWVMGCNLYFLLNTEVNGDYVSFVNNCYVDAPTPPTGVDQFGFTFSSSGTGHWETDPTFTTGASAPGTWNYTGAGSYEEEIGVVTTYTPTDEHAYWDVVSFGYYFWYKLPNDPNLYFAGLSGSASQQNGKGAYY